MGISGHMLGAAKLRRLAAQTGLPLNRAYRRNGECEGRVIEDGNCRHYTIDWQTGHHQLIERPEHWSSCPKFSA